MRMLRKCKKCGEYTLLETVCPYCGGEVNLAHPMKFSIDDKYWIYKQKLKNLENY